MSNRQSAHIRPLRDIAQALGLLENELVPYGRLTAKVDLAVLKRLAGRPHGRYVLVTATNPTPMGEGKTTIAIGLAMALYRQGRRAVVTLRQPSLGPVFGIKGGGAGGGRACLVPLEEVNLHLTGDAHAVATSHNLLAAFVDNHLFHGNSLGIKSEGISWPRVMGISDRALRPRFVITEASEVMAILALAGDHADLRRRLGRIIIGLTGEGRPVTAEELNCAGAMAVILKEALCPNLLQTCEGTPAFVHAGPFGNIAHGNSSVLADAIALRCADYVVTEAGFGSELGAEKFFHIKCRASGFRPHAVVVVTTLRALKLHGGAGAAQPGKPLPPALLRPNQEALTRGICNLEQHIANMKAFGVPTVVAINGFPEDSLDERRYVREQALAAGAFAAVVATPWADGGEGATELAHAVEAACAQPSSFAPLYADTAPLKEKIGTIARRLYGASGVAYSPQAEAGIARLCALGLGHLPVCMAKTPLSLSHDAGLKGRPSGFTVPVRELRPFAGAGFLTAICSGVQLMPGLPKQPAGERIDLDPETGEIVGLS